MVSPFHRWENKLREVKTCRVEAGLCHIKGRYKALDVFAPGVTASSHPPMQGWV